MSASRVKRIAGPSVALVALALVLMVIGLAIVGPTAAATKGGAAATEPTKVADVNRGVIVQFGNPIKIGAHERVQAVVAFGGDVTIAGTVTDTVVAFGGDVHVLPSATIGRSLSTDEPAIVALGGAVTVDEGARMYGSIESHENGFSSWGGVPQVLDDLNPRAWAGFSFLGWLVQTLIFLVHGLVAAALLPKQMQAVGRTVMRRPGASLGWGALTFFIIVPIVAVILIVTIIGILVVIPAIVIVPLFYFFASVAVASMIAQLLLTKGGRQEGLMLATAFGIVGTSIIAQIPVAGALAVLVMILFGTGAAVLATINWRRERRAVAAPVPPWPNGPAGGAYPPLPSDAPLSPAPAAPNAMPASNTASSLAGAASAPAPTAASEVPAAEPSGTSAPPLGAPTQALPAAAPPLVAPVAPQRIAAPPMMPPSAPTQVEPPAGDEPTQSAPAPVEPVTEVQAGEAVTNIVSEPSTSEPPENAQTEDRGPA